MAAIYRKQLVGLALLSVVSACVPGSENADTDRAERGTATAETAGFSASSKRAQDARDPAEGPLASAHEAAAAHMQGVDPNAEPEGPALVLLLPWGSNAHEVGRIDGDESASEGPMSFAVTSAGEIYVLDQVNLRVLVFRSDGTQRLEIPIAANSYQDIEVTGDGHILLLDRLAHPSILVIDESGGIVAEREVLGDGIPEGGGITAMFARRDGVWLEYTHSYVVKLLDTGFRSSTRYAQPGRIYRQGIANASAALDRSRGVASIWLSDPSGKATHSSAEISLEYPIARIITIDSDAAGYLHVFLHVVEPDPLDPRKVASEKVVGIRYDENLVQTGKLTSPHTITEWEQFREFRVTDAGAVYQMAFDSEGVRFYRWRW